jgi:hypothetical protein
MQTGIAPPQGFALSIFLSNITHSILGFFAKISAAQEPAGPPPTTATRNFFPMPKILLSTKNYAILKGSST